MSGDSTTANHVEHEIATFPGSSGRRLAAPAVKREEEEEWSKKKRAVMVTGKNRITIYGRFRHRQHLTVKIQFRGTAAEGFFHLRKPDSRPA